MEWGNSELTNQILAWKFPLVQEGFRERFGEKFRKGLGKRSGRVWGKVVERFGKGFGKRFRIGLGNGLFIIGFKNAHLLFKTK